MGIQNAIGSVIGNVQHAVNITKWLNREKSIDKAALSSSEVQNAREAMAAQKANNNIARNAAKMQELLAPATEEEINQLKIRGGI